MDSESASQLFIYLSFQEGEVLLNLNQIVFVRDISDEQITLDLSNGREVTIHGESAVTRVIGLLAKYSAIPEGTPLAQFFLDREKMH
jgi:hypothetical protein